MMYYSIYKISIVYGDYYYRRATVTKWCIDVKLVFNVYMKIWFLSKMIHSKYLKFKFWLIFVLKVTHYILHDPVDCAHACPLLQIVAPPPSPLELERGLAKISLSSWRNLLRAATIYWAHISSLHRYSRHYKFKLNFHERFHVHIQPQWIHVLILWSYHWKVNVKFIEQIQKNIFKLNLQMTNHINAF